MKYSDFLNYCASFYLTGHDPVYPLASPSKGFLTSSDLMDVCHRVMCDFADFCGDSFDREAVAAILCDEYGYEYPQANIKISA